MNFRFLIYNFQFTRFNSQTGITLLLVVVILSAILTISIGIFNVIYGEILISGEIVDSFIAFYASDEGIEKTLYRDKVQNDPLFIAGGEYCEGDTSCPTITTPISIESGACYKFRIVKTAVTEIFATGQYRCGADDLRIVKRGFRLEY